MAKLGFDAADAARVHVADLDESASDEQSYQVLRSTLQNRRLNIVFDNGKHATAHKLKSFNQIKPFLADRYLYFIKTFDTQVEGRQHVIKSLGASCPSCSVHEESLELNGGPSRVFVLARGV